MKNLLAILSLLLFYGNLNAQSDETLRQLFAGGSVSFSFQKNQVPYIGTILGIPGAIYSSNPNDSRTYSVYFSSNFGKEINQHWSVGLKLLYRNNTNKSETPVTFMSSVLVDTKRTSHQIGTGFFARYIFNPSKKFNFFLQPFIDINTATENSKTDNNTTSDRKVNYLTFGSDAGLLYNINEKFRVTVTVGGLSFAAGKWKNLLNDDSNNFFIFNSSFRSSAIYFGGEFKL
jgi:hypothetical protein